MAQLESDKWQSSLRLFHMIGYGLLLFVLLDIIYIFFPPHFMDPIWEFQMLGAVVERAPLPLLALVLIFYGETNLRARWEKNVLKLLSRFSLLVGLLFLLLILLGIGDAIRIYNINNKQINEQLVQQQSKIQQFEDKLLKAKDHELEDIIKRVNTENGSFEIKDAQQLRVSLLTEANKSERNLKIQAEATRKTKNNALIKSSVKWNLGCLIAGDLFIRVWQATRWARGPSKQK